MLPVQTGHLDDDSLLHLEKAHFLKSAIASVMQVAASRRASQGSTPGTVTESGTYDGEGNWQSYLRLDLDNFDSGLGLGP